MLSHTDGETLGDQEAKEFPDQLADLPEFSGDRTVLGGRGTAGVRCDDSPPRGPGNVYLFSGFLNGGGDEENIDAEFRHEDIRAAVIDEFGPLFGGSVS